MMFEMFLSVNM